MMRGLAKPRDAVSGRAVDTRDTTTTLKSLVDLGYVQANLDDAWQACGAGVNGTRCMTYVSPLRINCCSQGGEEPSGFSWILLD